MSASSTTPVMIQFTLTSLTRHSKLSNHSSVLPANIYISLPFSRSSLWLFIHRCYHTRDIYNFHIFYYRLRPRNFDHKNWSTGESGFKSQGEKIFSLHHRVHPGNWDPRSFPCNGHHDQAGDVCRKSATLMQRPMFRKPALCVDFRSDAGQI